MATFANILIVHPGAIGDVILATPVAATLKYNFPKARISYLTHPSLVQLLGLCCCVDKVLSYERQAGLFKQWNMVVSVNPNLIVDLAGSFKSWMLTRLTAATKVVRYSKQKHGTMPVEHAVDNFLATLQPLALRPLEPQFPTLTPGQDVTKAVTDRLSEAGFNRRTFIGLVPGVGKLRPHRAWIGNGWVTLARHIIDELRYVPVLVGGPDDKMVCREIAEQVGTDCVNLAGELSLTQTTALLKLCCVVVSGDTGPAHIAVAVGTPVVGLYGPTLPERSGPYGCSQWLVDHSGWCQCHNFKFCQLTGVPNLGSGECMRHIAVQEVLEKLRLALEWNISASRQMQPPA